MNKHATILILAALALLLAACGVSEAAADKPELIVTVNVKGGLNGRWDNWKISDQAAPDTPTVDCTLYRIPNTSPQQWTGACEMGYLGLMGLPWAEDSIMAVVEDSATGSTVIYNSVNR